MHSLHNLKRKHSSSRRATEHEPAIARYYAPEEIAGFQAELNLICQLQRAGFEILTAREINEQAAHILARAAQGREKGGI